MRKVTVALVIVGIMGLLAVPATAKTIKVRASVSPVWTLTWVNDTVNFGGLSTANLSGTVGYGKGLGWLQTGTQNMPNPIKFTVRTNQDYQIRFGTDIDHLKTTFDNLGGGSNPLLGPGYDTGIDGNVTNAIIQTQYKAEVTGTWYDNGKKDGPFTLGIQFSKGAGEWVNAQELKEVYWDDVGTGPNMYGPGDDCYDHHWTGGFVGTFKLDCRIRPFGIGQQPGDYNGDFTLTVAPHQWDGN